MSKVARLPAGIISIPEPSTDSAVAQTALATAAETQYVVVLYLLCTW
jgi:hypothetical protein